MDGKVLRTDENYTEILGDWLVLNESPFRYLNTFRLVESELVPQSLIICIRKYLAGSLKPSRLKTITEFTIW